MVQMYNNLLCNANELYSHRISVEKIFMQDVYKIYIKIEENYCNAK